MTEGKDGMGWDEIESNRLDSTGVGDHVAMCIDGLFCDICLS